MKTVGLIGGVGPESTIEYYRFISSEAVPFLDTTKIHVEKIVERLLS